MSNDVSPAVRQLATFIRSRHKAGSKPYTLLLGSGLSLTPEVRQAVCGSDDWEAFWTMIRDSSSAERRVLLADPLDDLNLTAGYDCLTQLVQAGYFDLVLTLNVDDALDESLRILSAREYQIFTHGPVHSTEIVAALDRTHPRVKVVKLRGDINAQTLPLTPQGQFEFPSDLEETVEKLLSQDTILVGDISFDADIQRCIHRSEGALWVVVPEEPRPGSFLYNAKQARPTGKIISGPEAEFVPFFSALAGELGVESAQVGDRLAPVRGPVARPAPSAPPTSPIRSRWALLVGVNHYVDPAFPPLKFCVNDVLALEEALKALSYTVVALHDDAPEERLSPTRDNVEAELARLCQVVEPNDLLLVHFACHGKLVDGQPLLVTRETRAPNLKKKALPLAEVERQMRESQARRLVLTLDACHTGVEIGRDLADPEFIRNAYELAEGFVLIAASTAQQIAQEWKEKEHGVFTYYLLEGLSGQADRDSKGFVTVDDLKTHALDGLRRWNVEHGGLLQEPTARTEGLGDIIIADYRD